MKNFTKVALGILTSIGGRGRHGSRLLVAPRGVHPRAERLLRALARRLPFKPATVRLPLRLCRDIGNGAAIEFACRICSGAAYGQPRAKSLDGSRRFGPCDATVSTRRVNT